MARSLLVVVYITYPGPASGRIVGPAQAQGARVLNWLPVQTAASPLGPGQTPCVFVCVRTGALSLSTPGKCRAFAEAGADSVRFCPRSDRGAFFIYLGQMQGICAGRGGLRAFLSAFGPGRFLYLPRANAGHLQRPGQTAYVFVRVRTGLYGMSGKALLIGYIRAPSAKSRSDSIPRAAISCLRAEDKETGRRSIPDRRRTFKPAKGRRLTLR